MTGDCQPQVPSLVATICLHGKAESVPVARRWFRSLLGPRHPVADDVELAGCELMTNSLRHSDSGHGGHIALILDADERRVRAYVTDDGGSETEPHVYDATTSEESGRGMRLVEAVSDDWGTYVEDGGRITWFEIRLQRSTPRP